MRPELLPGLLRAAARNQARGLRGAGAVRGRPGLPRRRAGRTAAGLGRLLVGRTGAARRLRSGAGGGRIRRQGRCRGDAVGDGRPGKVQILRDGAGLVPPRPPRRASASGPRRCWAVFGEVHPKVLRELDVKGPAMAFTLWPEDMPDAAQATRRARPALELSDLQAVERDFAFVVGRGRRGAGAGNGRRGPTRR